MNRTRLSILTALGLSLAGAAAAHGPDGSPGPQGYGWHQGWHMGPGMMGPGYGGYMGPGMMGPGYGGYMGPGMMGPGYGGYMGPGMMGPGYGGYMGPGMMGPGYGGNTGRPLDTGDVTRMMQQHLAWRQNPNLKLGSVTETDDDTITVEIVTKDGSLVEKLSVDRATGTTTPLR